VDPEVLIGELFGTAFVRSIAMATVVNGFRKSRIYPLDPTEFANDFLPAETTDIPAVLNVCQKLQLEVQL
jgi:hypothetical protein